MNCNKAAFFVLAGLLCFRLVGCGAETPEKMPDAYDTIIRRYETAIAEGWDTERMTENGLNYMVAYCLERDDGASVGYYKGDLNGDGQTELAIAAKSEDDYFAGMIFALYELSDGEPFVLVQSGERDHWYYAGEGRLLNEAFGNAFEFVCSLCAADRKLSCLDAVGRNAVEYPDAPWLRFTGETWEHISGETADAVLSEMKSGVTNPDITLFS